VTAFDPTRCDLCGSTEFADRTLLAPRSMRSDGVIEPRPLLKRLCRRCGLAREGRPQASAADVYAGEYTPAAADYVFHTADGPRKRSEVFADWVCEHGGVHWATAKRALEIGAGAGGLMAALAARFPACRFEGLELSRSAAAAAREAGQAVESTDVSEWNEGPYDAVYAVAVLEHVPSPTAFLRRLRELLTPDGVLVLTQPTQDVTSHDILFTDHLHHFGTAHLRAYAGKIGFREAAAAVGHPLMTNFSLHVWRVEGPAAGWEWAGPQERTTVAESLDGLAAAFTRCDERLELWERGGRTAGVFGLSEVFDLARAYTTLGEADIRGGLHDAPERVAGRFPFPVVRPEDARKLGIDAVLIAANKVWLPRIEPRLRRLGLETHPVFS
jgi:SAM-dependent methyltransferase